MLFSENMASKVTWLVLLSMWCIASTHPAESNYGAMDPKQETKKPYSFSYGIKDDYRGTAFQREEKSDGDLVIGSYSVQLPDGRKQTVTYEADHHKGFIAKVSYEGEARYPPPSKEPPFVVRVLTSDFLSDTSSFPVVPKPVVIHNQEQRLFHETVENEVESSQSDEEALQESDTETELKEFSSQPESRYRPNIHHSSISVPYQSFGDFEEHAGNQYMKELFSHSLPSHGHNNIRLQQFNVAPHNRLKDMTNKKEMHGEIQMHNLLDKTHFPLGFLPLSEHNMMENIHYEGIPLSHFGEFALQSDETENNLYIPRFTLPIKPFSVESDQVPLRRSHLNRLHIQPFHHGSRPKANLALRKAFNLSPKEVESEDETNRKSDEEGDSAFKKHNGRQFKISRDDSEDPERSSQYSHRHSSIYTGGIHLPPARGMSLQEPRHDHDEKDAEDTPIFKDKNSSVSLETLSKPSKEHESSKW